MSEWTREAAGLYLKKYRKSPSFTTSCENQFYAECKNANGVKEIARLFYRGSTSNFVFSRVGNRKWLHRGLMEACLSNNLQIFEWLFHKKGVAKPLSTVQLDQYIRHRNEDNVLQYGLMRSNIELFRNLAPINAFFLISCAQQSHSVMAKCSYSVSPIVHIIGLLMLCQRRDCDGILLLNHVRNINFHELIYGLQTIDNQEFSLNFLIRINDAMATILIPKEDDRLLAGYVNNLAEKVNAEPYTILNLTTFRVYVCSYLEHSGGTKYREILGRLLQDISRHGCCLTKEWEQSQKIRMEMIDIMIDEWKKYHVSLRIEEEEDEDEGLGHYFFTDGIEEMIGTVYCHGTLDIAKKLISRLVSISPKSNPPTLYLRKLYSFHKTGAIRAIAFNAIRNGITIRDNDWFDDCFDDEEESPLSKRGSMSEQILEVVSWYREALEVLCRHALLIVFLKRVAVMYSIGALIKRPVYI